MLRRALLSFACVASLALAAPDQETPAGDATIRAWAGPSDIVITTTNRLAGAIHSLTWNGKEFIDSTDHGRQLQSACAFDCGDIKNFWAEAYNPTEAGTRQDGAGPTSSSKLLSIAAKGRELRTTTQMAFWLAPGEKSEGRPARNTQVLSRYVLSKHVRIGYQDLPHAIEYEVTFTVPQGEKHTLAQFEILTGYMPAEFSTFETLGSSNQRLEPVGDGPGEQPLPLVFSTPDGKHALGIRALDSRWLKSTGPEAPGYGRWRFRPEKVVKWNCVRRVQAAEGVAAGDYDFRVIVAVGSREDVRKTLIALPGDRPPRQ